MFIQRFFEIRNYCFVSPTVLYACKASKSNNFLGKTNHSNVKKKFQYYFEKLLKSKAVQLVTLVVKDYVTCEFT